MEADCNIEQEPGQVETADQSKLAEALGRRAEWQAPEGTTQIAEYWSPKGSPTVISIFETEDAATIDIITSTWMDVLEVDVFPVVTWEEGLEKLSQHFG